MGFLSGISSEVRGAIVEYWGDWAGSAAKEHFAKALPRLSSSTLGVLGSEVERLALDAVANFGDVMAEREYKLYIAPTLQSIGSLPKDELGLLAESLVSITSLKQRMSIFDYQTVGGPIDVALISLGDGFVWLKRKHYFSADLNPSWHLTHLSSLGHRRNMQEDSDGDSEA